MEKIRINSLNYSLLGLGLGYKQVRFSFQK